MQTGYLVIGSDWFKHFLSNASEEELERAIGVIKPFMSNYEIDLQNHKSVDVIKVLYDVIDESVKSQKEDNPQYKITCKKSCSACCHLNVDVSKEEVDYIIDYLKNKDIKLDLALLKEQAEVKEWNDLPHPKRRCIFLGEKGECRIYKARPITCRIYFTVDKAEFCDTRKYLGKIIKMFTVPYAELLRVGVYNVSPPTRLSTQVYERLK